MTIEAMKAIQMVYANTTKHDWPDDIWDAICQAIESEKQEPADYIETKARWGKHFVEVIDPTKENEILRMYYEPPKRTWVDLTPEEVVAVANSELSPKYFARGAAWANAKLKEKNS